MSAGVEELLVEVTMPRLSDSMEEATVSTWLKAAGDAVAKGEPLVEVETDKATIVYEAEVAGVLEEIVVGDGETAALGAVIARMRTSGARKPAAAAAKAAAPERRPEPQRPQQPARQAEPAGGRARATPVARRLAAQLGVSLAGVAGTGPGGRIVRADVLARSDGAAPAAQPASGRGAVTELPHTPTQRTIAQRMAESRSQIPEFTLEVEIPMDAVVALRAELKTTGCEPTPSYNDLLVKAVALALRDFPSLNAAYEPGKTLRFERINVGIAVDAGDALLVPTIHDADRKSVFEIAAAARRVAERGRSRSLTTEELADGTFTISNLGMLGVRRFHAVINHPQVAILSVGEVARRPWVDEDGSLVARTTMEVALSCDHRVVYGAEAARFLQRLRYLLEHPVNLVLE